MIRILYIPRRRNTLCVKNGFYLRGRFLRIYSLIIVEESIFCCDITCHDSLHHSINPRFVFLSIRSEGELFFRTRNRYRRIFPIYLPWQNQLSFHLGRDMTIPRIPRTTLPISSYFYSVKNRSCKIIHLAVSRK